MVSSTGKKAFLFWLACAAVLTAILVTSFIDLSSTSSVSDLVESDEVPADDENVTTTNPAIPARSENENYSFWKTVLSSSIDEDGDSKGQALFLLEQKIPFEGRSAANNTLQPYILCSTTPGLSATEREMGVREAFDLGKIGVKVIKNRGGATCFISALQKGGPEEGTIPAEFPYMKLAPMSKLRRGASSGATNATAAGEKQLLLQLCPHIQLDVEAYDDVDLMTTLGVTSGDAPEDKIFDFWFLDEDVTDFIEEIMGEVPQIMQLLQIAVDSGVECGQIFEGMSTEIVDPSNIILHLPENSNPLCIIQIAMTLTVTNEICSVERKKPAEIENVNAQWISQSGYKNYRPWFDIGVDGSGQIVTVSDTGLDINNCYFWDAEVTLEFRTYQPENRKVVFYQDYKDRIEFGDNDHGTHVAGTVAGRRAVDGINESDGLADGKLIVLYSIESN